MGKKRRFILAHHRSPGDLVCLTALMRDIHLAYPGEFETDFNTTVQPVWANNPYVTRLWNHKDKSPQITVPDTRLIACQYGKGIREQNNETIHFCSYFHRDFHKQTGIKVPLTAPHGDLHLSAEEKNTPPVQGRYWLMLTGGKSDFTIKVWHSRYFQEVTDQLGDMGLGVVQTGAAHTGHWHPKLTGDHVIDLCGWGGFREFMQQIYHAEGVICGVTAAMHIAAALHKPCVVIAGGREAWWWEAYVNENRGFGPQATGKHPMPHRFLHTIGLLDCCSHHGCWRNKVVSLGNDKQVCTYPIITQEMPVAKCMQMITPEHVMKAVGSYYTDGSLPPIRLESSSQIPQPDAIKQVNAEIVDPATSALGTCAPIAGQRQHVRTSASIVIPTGMPISINPKARINVRDKPGPARPGQPAALQEDIMDNPAVGGKFTVCVLCYGDYFELHKKCVSSILATVPGKRIDLRVATNAANQATIDMIDDFVRQGLISKHYRHTENDFKYPVMREMFWDDSHPITTKWVLWFDDDSICDVEPNWATILATHISQHHKGKDAHMVGANFVWTTNKKQRDILASRPWYKGRQWRSANGQPSPNGQKIIFVAGGFWAITHEAIRAADIPDLGTGLTHNGGDWQIGEQLYQAGYGLKQFNGQKQFVRTSSVDRRGVTKPTIDQVTRTNTISPPQQPPVQPPVAASQAAPPKPAAVQPKLRRILEL